MHKPNTKNNYCYPFSPSNRSHQLVNGTGKELERLGWRREELAARRKGDPAKLAIAARLRKETTLTIKSIAARLYLGTSRSAHVRLHGWMGSDALAGAKTVGT